MKKTVSVLLALLMLFSFAAIPAAAELEPAITAYEVYFMSPNGTQLNYGVYPKGTELSLIAKNWEPDSYVEDGLTYYFIGWKNEETGIVRSSDQLPKLNGNVTYIAQFEAQSAEGQSLLSFFASIFARMNRIFEYFWNIFFADRT